MVRVRWLLLGLAILLLATGGAAAWAYAQQRYPALVYYSRLSLATGSPYWAFGKSTVVQEWTDPLHHRERLRIDGLAEPIDRVLRDGREYDGNTATHGLLAGSTTAQWLGWLLQQGCAGTREAASMPAAGPQRQLDIGSGYVATVRCVRYRVQPGTLPADFFNPPHSQQSPWDQLLSWLTTHLGRKAGQPPSYSYRAPRPWAVNALR